MQPLEMEFLRDRERHFRIVARRNGLLGLWAAKCLGLWGNVADDYAMSIVDSEIVGRGDKAVIDKLTRDLWRCAVPITEREIRDQLNLLDAKARADVNEELASSESMHLRGSPPL